MIKGIGLVSLAALSVGLCGTANAQSVANASPGLSENSNEIVVTAQRREERSRDVPISVTSLSAATLQQTNITSTIDLQKVTPGLVMARQNVFTQPAIRGISTDNLAPMGENPVAIYVDGVYQPSMQALTFDLPDVENVQVLKGPQGTLFGRNATGGAILITTKAPDLNEVTGRGKLAYGNFNEILAAGVVSVPIVQDRMALSLSGYYTRMDSFNRNSLTGEKGGRNSTKMVRGKLRLIPWEGADFTLSGLYAKRNYPGGIENFSLGGNNAYAAFATPGQLATEPHTFSSNLEQSLKTTNYSVSLHGDIEVGPGTLSTTTAWLSTPVKYLAEGDYTSLPANSFFLANQFYLNDASSKSFSQELLYNTDQIGIFTVTAGLNYYKADGGWDSINFSNLLGIYTHDSVRAYAGFGQVTAQVSPALKISGGLRYSIEKQIGRAARTAPNGPAVGGSPLPTEYPVNEVGRKTWHALTPRITAVYEVSTEANIYASWGKGFKTGSFNSSSLLNKPVNPEKIEAYEAGAKLGSGPVSFNIAGFYYDYSDLQVATTVGYPNNPVSVLENAAKAEIYGAEIELRGRVARGLTVTGALSWLSAKYTQYRDATIQTPVAGGGNAALPTNVDGNWLPRAPEITGSVRVNYETETSIGTISVSGDVYYTSEYFFEPSNRIKQSSYALVGGQLNWSPSSMPDLKLGVYGRNLTDKGYLASVQIVGQADSAQYNQPRTYGVQLQYSF
ncbi:hypothetical protein BSL82_11935 [Tardibacter chloracetimidivorans]|uniref:TonB-dependent receptor n=2 Tax=Tardibacter chloracetimidivorans TaxID=1921510 RepID=A0A1L3ZWC5_9SPHN|nr:hypothetical protein BSL82_11935 [Tardibacter chloracetimidivorans]